MDKKGIIIVAILLTLSSALVLYQELTAPIKTEELCFPQICVHVEIADSPSERAQDLMFRESLPENQGMLFIFPNPQEYSFWMKNTLIPLDMIWISQNGTIADIQTAQPCKTDPCPSYTPKKPAKYVLEVNAGLTEKYGIKIGNLALLP